ANAAAAFVPTMCAMAAAAENWCYVATCGEQEEFAGGAALSLVWQGRIACLSGASTLPAHRGRGLQTTMLWHRLADAAAAGYELAYVSTLPETSSARNQRRAGFVEAYRRRVMVAAL